MSEIAVDHLVGLNAGRVEARTLTEALAIDHRVLLRAAIPDAAAELTEAVETAQSLGHPETYGSDRCSVTPAPPSRGPRRACCTPLGVRCVAGCASRLLQTRRRHAETLLLAIQPFADDPRFTVREWVWMAVRPRLTSDLPGSIELLIPWTREESANLRRFASESLRPRGVWASHIAALKQNPAIGEPLLEPLRSDPSRYVQDSVANWINDAAKTNPEWARELCERWRVESPTAATTRITARALRSLK